MQNSSCFQRIEHSKMAQQRPQSQTTTSYRRILTESICVLKVLVILVGLYHCMCHCQPQILTLSRRQWFRLLKYFSGNLAGLSICGLCRRPCQQRFNFTTRSHEKPQVFQQTRENHF